jgi:hypothetical protein
LEAIRENIRITAKESVSCYELKEHRPWFDEGCSELLDERKQSKFQWLQDPREINMDNIEREANERFRNKKRGYLKHKINELVTKRRNKNIREGIEE